MAALGVSEPPRLNNNEFLNYIPHLELEELLMTQIKANGSWDYLFKASIKKENKLSSLTCIACQELIKCQKFSSHLKEKSHEESLKNVEQFYHPYYTNDKECGNIKSGENISDRDTETDTVRTKSITSSEERSTLSTSKMIAECIRESEGDLDLVTDNENFTNIILRKDVTKPEDLLVDVKLPLTDILNIEFCTEKGRWVRMITVNKTASTKFYCALCSKFCFGIITVDCHLKGFTHKRAQISCLGVRCSSYKNLTKNCIFGYGETFCINIQKTENFEKESSPNSNDVEKLKKIEDTDEDKNLGSIQKVQESNIKPSLSATIANKVKNIKEKMRVQNKYVEGLIGVEYVVKILKTKTDKYPMYECCLCEIVLNENRMQGHLTGYNHRLKYCELHYPNTIEKFKNVIGHVKYIDYFNAMNHILSKIASAIEQHHGRSTPYVVLLSIFTKMRTELIAKIYSYPNACQQHGPSFTNVMTEEEIKQIIREQTEYVAHTNNYARFVEKPEKKLYLNQRCHDPNKRNGDNFDIRKRKRSPSPPKKYSKSLLRSLSPHQIAPTKRNKESRQHLAYGASVSSFQRDEVAVVTFEIERMYKEYRKNPESHPLYDEEWNGFWRRRKEQLVSQGIDHRSYNYQPEWVKYFKNRLEELFEKEISDSKREIRNRLSDYEINNSSNLLAHIKDFGLKSDNTYELQNEKRSPDVISQSANSRYLENEMRDGKPTVIHVLRLLTALEDYLGSLGTKIMDLLSKALMIEKNCNNSQLEQQILTFHNCTLLETAVEKLKGLLFAGLLDRSKVQGFNRVIQFTTDLLKHADKMGWRNIQTSFSNKVENPVFLKLAGAVESTRAANTFPSTQKLLSDTLMELLSMQKNNNNSAFNNSHNQKTYNDQSQGICGPGIDRFGEKANSRGSHWQNPELNSSYFLTKSTCFERSFNGAAKNVTNNQNYNSVNNTPGNIGNVGTFGNRPNPNYKPISVAQNYQNYDFVGAIKRNASLNNQQC
ncbi:uncharacterized protein LOC128871859 isoform X1 [Anastrepha ludens]|uniref:uncharacterized protein LOC128871859 isoform X1 n=1 Tax=Anastrepha ludens TaxID=28586 RepID=UPI0023AF57F7|nr:uncharacterized protein LOC128871859 isoform X1 [Anastrepha ludens]